MKKVKAVESARMRVALVVISECAGKTLLGEYCNTDKELERQHEIGANKAYEECARIAKHALRPINKT